MLKKAFSALFITMSTWSLAAAAPPAAPALQNPADAAVLQPINLTLAWAASAGAANYQVQVSEEPDFTPASVNVENVTDLFRAVGPLKNKTTYYWHVRARNADGYGPYGAARTFTTVEAAPGVPVPFSPAASAVDIPLNAPIVWRKSAGTTAYQIQVSVKADFSTTVHDDAAETDTAVTVGPLATATVHHWRVRAKNAGGTSEWSPARSFTTVPAVPAVPALLTPADKAEQVALPASITWHKADRAATYRLQVSASAEFAAPVLEVSIRDTAHSATTLKYATDYHWRVRAENAGGNSPWSAVRTFSTLETPPAPALVSPAADADDQPVDLRLVWKKSARAVTYQLQVSKAADFATTVYDGAALADTGAAPGGLANNTAYFWRVRAKNAAGNSAWSAGRKFTTIVLLAPPAPVLATPKDGAVGLAVNPTLRWEAAARAASYRIQVSATPSFSATVFDEANIAGLSRQITALANSGLFYWRVQAKNAAGDGAWSSIWSFNTQVGAVAEPVPSSPADNAAKQARELTLNWEKAANAVSYRLQVSKNADFSSPVVDDSSLTGTSADIGPLANGTTYYWHVRAKNAAGVSDYSDSRKFTVIMAVPATPSLTGPGDNATELDFDLTFRWADEPRAATYTLQVSGTATFATLSAEHANLSVTSADVKGLKPGTWYFWRVRGANEGGAGPWSEIRSFKTKVSTSLRGLVPDREGFHLAPSAQGVELSFSLPKASAVRITLADPATGRMTELVNGAFASGLHRVAAPSAPRGMGIYLVRMEAGAYEETRKVFLGR